MKEISVSSRLDNVDLITEFVNDCLGEQDCSMKIQVQLDVAIDEIFSNICNYAYPDGSGMVILQLEFSDSPKAVTIRFIDNGEPFNPLNQEKPDVTLGAEERKVGGLGIFIVIRTMDAVHYQNENGKNIFTMYKKF